MATGPEPEPLQGKWCWGGACNQEESRWQGGRHQGDRGKREVGGVRDQRGGPATYPCCHLPPCRYFLCCSGCGERKFILYIKNYNKLDIFHV